MPSLTTSILPDGPVIRVAVSVSAPRSAALVQAGMPVPQPVGILEFLDTGADCTAIDTSVFAQLGLAPTGTTEIITPSTGKALHTCNEFDVALSIFLDNHLHFLATLPVIETDLRNQRIQALIGRDVLNQGILIFNGSAGTLTLAF